VPIALARWQASGHPSRMSIGLTDYVVDWSATGSGNGAEALRVCFRSVASEVSQYECDLPTWGLDTEALQAAAVLLGVARKTHLSLPATGILKPGDAAVWDAFVIFAPHALDGSVWTATGDGRPTVDFADEATAISVRLDAEQRERLAQDLPAGNELVPASEWRARRKKRD
jgi:hypothetical protein